MRDLSIPVHPDYLEEIDSNKHKQDEIARCASSFRYFLNYWPFVDQETGEQKLLGDHIWAGQEQIVEAMENVPKFYNLKARKLGATTLEIAYDGWVVRFRDANARVHLFSRRDEAAKELLENVKYGLERLPPWMQLPYAKKPTQTEIRFRAERDDQRVLKSYPTGKETAVEGTCTHGHVDEWARMGDPENVWQAIEPTMAGSCHIITTGRGPTNFTAKFWRRCMAGDTDYVPIFVSALNRPDRDGGWLERKRKGMTEQAFKQEFPMSWEDALFSGGRLTFQSADIDVAGAGMGPTEAESGHKYIKSWDIGRHRDAAVGTVIDVTRSPNEVVEYVRLRGVPYPSLQKTIERVHGRYPGRTVIEKNGPGEAVAENLDIPARELILFNTSQKSKAKIIEELQLALENHTIRWDASSWPQLDSEVRGYQIPDNSIVQDSVMSLAIGNAHASAVLVQGRVGKVMTWG